MIDTHLFSSDLQWRKLCRHRPTVLAVFSFRYDADLVPDLVAHLKTMVDGFVAFDDRNAEELFSNAPSRRRALIETARELGASWGLAIARDERFERALSTRIRFLTESPRRIIWQFQLREMYSLDTYRIDGIWGLKEQGRLFPIFDGPFCSGKNLHGAWCSPPNGYLTVPTGLNLYHLKMISQKRRDARRALYNYLDPDAAHQLGGYDYLTDEHGAKFEMIPKGRDFFPAHDERILLNVPMPDVVNDLTRGHKSAALANTAVKPQMPAGAASSQLKQFIVETGAHAKRDCDIAVVVIGLGAPPGLLSAVLSLLQQQPVPEIVVVNSGGGRAADVLESVRHRITIVEVEEPIFVGAARNIGIRMARAPYVCFLAADCIAELEWISHRLQIHANGAVAVSSVVVCGTPSNVFAQAAYLLTYGRRMPGLPAHEVARYGASYDRTLFDRYGLFSEYLRVGEDSEFHRRLRHSDSIQHSDAIRTIHADPTRLARLVSDQFARGRRARYLCEFLAGDCGFADIFVGAYRRFAMALSRSAKCAGEASRLSLITLWLAMCSGGVAFLAGSIVSYARVLLSRYLSLRATEALSCAADDEALLLLRRAMELRPNFPPLARRYGRSLASTGEIHLAADHLFRAAEMEHACLWSSLVLPICPPECSNRTELLALTIVILSYAPTMRLAELLNALGPQLRGRNGTRLIVVRGDVTWFTRRRERRVRAAHARFVDFLMVPEFLSRCAKSSLGFSGHGPDYVVITTDDFMPPADWLQTFDDYARSMREVDFFEGSIRPSLPSKARHPGWVEDMVQRLALIPQHNGDHKLFEFSPAMSVGCRASVYDRCGGLLDDDNEAIRGIFGLRAAVTESGGVIQEATDWVTSFRCDVGFPRLLSLSWTDGVKSMLHKNSERRLSESKTRSGALGGAIGLIERAAVFSQRCAARAPPAAGSRATRYLWHSLLFGLGLARQVGREHGRNAWLRG